MHKPIRLLEIGTGSGGIAHYFGSHPDLGCEVTAVDVIDQRLVHEGYTFTKVNDTKLPFTNGSFDIVLSNHVIEHVGDRSAQLHHLREIRRVLSTKGVAYLAVPNRWMLVEPHYKLAFLSWLPGPLRTPYLRLMRRGQLYDCNPLSLSQLNKLLAEAGFSWSHVEIEAFRETLALEGTNSKARHIFSKLPNVLLHWLTPIIPTLICRLSDPKNQGNLPRSPYTQSTTLK